MHIRVLSDARYLREFPTMEGLSSLEILRMDRASLSDFPKNLCTNMTQLKSLWVSISNIFMKKIQFFFYDWIPVVFAANWSPICWKRFPIWLDVKISEFCEYNLDIILWPHFASNIKWYENCFIFLSPLSLSLYILGICWYLAFLFSHLLDIQRSVR